MKNKALNGFTLPELLVVIAISGVLAVTLLPSLNTAKETANAAVCLGNMHQWGLAISMYCEDYNDYFPYEGSGGSIDAGFSLNAWFNVVPRYINQARLVDLYNVNKPPKPGMKSIWICPSATNTTVSPTFANPYFMYGFNGRMDPNGAAQYKRSQMVSPTNTIIFAEEIEDNFPTTYPPYVASRHSGGANFVLGDGHAEWIKYDDFCRQCPANPFPNNDASAAGDWKAGIKYHWFPFKNSPT